MIDGYIVSDPWGGRGLHLGCEAAIPACDEPAYACRTSDRAVRWETKQRMLPPCLFDDWAL